LQHVVIRKTINSPSIGNSVLRNQVRNPNFHKLKLQWQFSQTINFGQSSNCPCGFTFVAKYKRLSAVTLIYLDL